MQLRVLLLTTLLIAGCLDNDPYAPPEKEPYYPIRLSLVGPDDFEFVLHYDPIDRESWYQCNYHWTLKAEGDYFQTAVLTGGRFITDWLKQQPDGSMKMTHDTVFRWDELSIRSIFFDRHFKPGDTRRSTGMGTSGPPDRSVIDVEFDYLIEKTGQRATAKQRIVCDPPR